MSKAYIITYDLNAKGQKYDKLIKAIKEEVSTGVWCSFWKSSYLFRSNLSPDQILEVLKPHLDNNDRMFVSELNNSYQGWLSKDDWEYINNHIF